MPSPLILSTWSFGRKANAAGWPHLTGPGASSLDAVERACRAVEADNRVHSVGRGGCPDRSGQVTLDASIMVSPSRCGSVCYLRQFAHPVTVARRVMEKLPLVVLLAGDGADRFATRQGLAPANLLTGRARATWQKWIMRHPSAAYRDDAAYPPPENLEESDALPEGEAAPHNRYHDTVGVLGDRRARARWPGPARPAACRSRFRGGWATRRSSAKDCMSIRGAGRPSAPAWASW